MKLSEAMRKGYSKVGKQCFNWSYDGQHENPTAVCAMGAASFELLGSAGGSYLNLNMLDRRYSYDILRYVARLNDVCKMPIPEIAEVLEMMGF